MNIYHISNGKVFRAPEAMSLSEYREKVRKAYGSLKGIRFVEAENRRLAQFKAAQGIFAR